MQILLAFVYKFKSNEMVLNANESSFAELFTALQFR